MGLEIEVGAFVPSIGHGLELDGRWRRGRLGHFGPWQAAAEIEHLGWIESHRWLDWEIHFRQAFFHRRLEEVNPKGIGFLRFCL